MSILSGDLIAFAENGWRSWIGIRRIGVVCSRNGEAMLAEARSEKTAVKLGSNSGGGFYRLQDVLDRPDESAWHYSLASPLYPHEYDRLRTILDFWEGKSIGNVELCVEALAVVGRIPPPRLPWTLSPQNFVRLGRLRGVYMKGQLL